MFQINREELAWAAGFFDGEGHVSPYFTNVRTANLHLRVNQIHPYVLKRFKKAVGVGRIRGPFEVKGRLNSQPQWKFEVTNHQEVQHIMAILWPWLSPVKRKQFLSSFHEWHMGQRRHAQYMSERASRNHGTYVYYKHHKCGCTPCVKAYKEYMESKKELEF